MSIENYRQTHTQTTRAALGEAAAVAGHAPSIHNTQPWRWHVNGDILELYAEPTRQLTGPDPGGRLMVLSCGAALHHARIALAALGWRAEVERLPNPGQPGLLARLTLSGRLTVTREAIRRLQIIRMSQAERRPIADAPPASSDLDAIRAAVEGEQARLHLLRPEETLDLRTSLDQALEEFDPQRRPAMPTSVGEPRVAAGHNDDAAHAILFGEEDTPSAWLHAGEALSAAWLTAIERGLSVVPLSAPLDVESTRLTLHRLLAQRGQPFLVLRLSHDDPDRGGPRRSPRLPSTQTVDVVG